MRVSPTKVMTILTIVAAACAAFGIGKPAMSASPVGDVVGKLVVGYQGWFSCAGDGTPQNSWRHWNGSIPSPGHQTFELWPDVREYSVTYPTGYANLGNGQPANLYAADQNQVVQKHFTWMQQYGIDTAAVQRFGTNLNGTATTNQMNEVLARCRNSAVAANRKFYVMYDISGWTNFATQIKTDWTNTVVGTLGCTASPAYAKQSGKPVVCIWGMGFTSRPGTAAQCIDVINWFKAQGCYVIGGVPRYWRTGTGDSQAGFDSVYADFNMLSPWTVGGFSGTAGADSYKTTFEVPDLAYCNSHGIDYQPVAFPGFAWSNWNGGTRNQIPRLHGDFMWEQYANIRSLSIPNVYVAMFDEYDEGTAIAKAAEDSTMIPTNQYFLTLNADGVHVTSDFYLRLTGDGAKMIKGITPLVWTHPTTH